MSGLSVTTSRFWAGLRWVGLAGLVLVGAAVVATVTALAGLVLALAALTLPLWLGGRRAQARARTPNRTLEARRTPVGWVVDRR
jgi:Flp pilus assembly protein TadB